VFGILLKLSSFFLHLDVKTVCQTDRLHQKYRQS